VAQSDRRWRSHATSHRDGEEREDKTQTGLLSDIYIVSYPWDKSPFLTIIPVQRNLGVRGRYGERCGWCLRVGLSRYRLCGNLHSVIIV
jgi:hypothetical protein